MDRAQFEAAVAAQERLRGVVDDEVIEATIAALRQQLSELGETRRRQATVLFADIVGFTALSETLDAEVVSGVVDSLWSRLDAAVIERGGRIDKHMGDGLMAVWGGEVSQEDDPERAVSAALDMQRLVAGFAEEVGHNLSMRIGLNTGAVVLGPVGTTGEYTAMGDAVNLASRLEQAAPSGGVCISHDTYRHVRGVFDVHPLEPLIVKGKAEPQRAYLVERTKPRAFRMGMRGVEGVETRMVGRDRELGALQSAFEETVAGGRSRLVTIVGEAGAGKSRLLYELTNWLELHDQRVFFFRGRSSPQRQRQPLGLVMDLLSSRARVADSDPPDVVLDKLAAEVANALTRPEAVVLATWLGFEVAGVTAGTPITGDGLGITAKAHLTSYLKVLAGEEPVVCLLEDIHWADDESLDLVTQIVSHLADQPLFVLAVTRPELVSRRPDWGSPGAGGVRVELGALDEARTSELVDEILQRAQEVPVELRRLVIERADGNPFYVEELIKTLIDDRVIVTESENGHWTIDEGHLAAERVPAGLTGVLQARLDGLPASDQRVLQHGAVVGRVFWDAAVASMSRSEAPPSLENALTRELVYRNVPAVFADTEQFVFKHALLRDVAYESVLLADRPGLHAAAAAWLESVVGPRRGEYLSVIAGHHRLAGDLSQAAECLAQSAETAMRSGQPRPALAAAEDAIALWAAAGRPPAAGTALTAAEAKVKLGDLDGADQAAATAIEQATIEDNSRTVVEATCCVADIAARRGHSDLRLELLRGVLSTAEELGGRPLASVLIGMTWSLVEAGELDGAEATATRALEVANGVDDASTRSRATDLMGVVAAERQDFDVALRFMEASLTLARQGGDLAAEANYLSNIGIIHHFRADETGSVDDYLAAKSRYAASDALARRLDLTITRLVVLNNLAQLHVRLGDPATALELSRDGLRTALDLGAIPDALIAVLYHAEALAALGDVDRALALIGMLSAHPALLATLHSEIGRALRRIGLDRAALASVPPLGFDEATAAVLG